METESLETTEAKERQEQKLEAARKELRRQLCDYLGGSESWNEQFTDLADAFEKLIDVKLEKLSG